MAQPLDPASLRTPVNSSALRLAATLATSQGAPWPSRFVGTAPPHLSQAAFTYESRLRTRFESNSERHWKFNFTFKDGVFPTVTFIHIAKNGGTAIEGFGAKHNIYWGRDYDYYRIRRGIKPIVALTDGDTPCVSDFSEQCCPWWHTPPKFVMERDPRLYLRAPIQFCVVRDPIERLGSIVAEQALPKVGQRVARRWCADRSNATLFNTVAQSWLRNGNVSSMTQPEMRGCHLVPQVQYLAPRFVTMASLTTAACQQRKALRVHPEAGCNVVLDFAHLEDDFDALMQWIGLRHQTAESTWQLPRLRDSGTSFKCKHVPPYTELFDEETRELVLREYAEDAALYERVSRANEARRGEHQLKHASAETKCSLAVVNGRQWGDGAWP